MSSFAKYIPISLVIGSTVIGAWLSGRPRGPQAVKKLFLYMTIFIITWAVMCFRYYPQYIFIE